MRFNVARSSKMFLGVSEVLVNVDEELMKELHLEKFQRL
jgi:hypothetical protein